MFYKNITIFIGKFMNNGLSIKNNTFQRNTYLKQNNKYNNSLKNNSTLSNQVDAVTPDSSLLKTYYLTNASNVSFQRSLKNKQNSHIEYLGATYLGENKANFRVYAPYAQKMELQIAKKEHDNKYWEDLSDSDYKAINCKTHKMNQAQENVWELKFNNNISPGDFYRFKLTDKEGNVKYLKDPRSFHQPKDTVGWSAVYDQKSFNWDDDKWMQGKNSKRFVHNGSPDHYGAPPGMIIDEIHVGLLGGFKKAKKEIDKVAEENICNTIYLMPVGEFYGKYNWGYDETDKFAPESFYGNPDELKEFVNYAHKKGINVILDVIPNHFGSIGTVVQEYGEAFDSSIETGWGTGLNFNKKGKEYMRHYMVDMMMNWLVNFHFDGLRIDAPGAMNSNSTLKLMTSEIRNHPETQKSIIIPEALGKTRVYTQGLNESEINDPLKTELEADNDYLKSQNLGFDSQYTLDFKNTLQALSINWQIFDCPPSINDLAIEYKQGYRFFDEESIDISNTEANTNLVYMSSHDENNPYAGARPLIRSLAVLLGLVKENSLIEHNGLDKEPFNKTFKILKAYLNKDYSVLEQHGVTRGKFENAYKKAQSINRLSLGSLFLHPGQKLIFMGDQKGELAPFRFFAEFDNPEITKFVEKEKGISIGKTSFDESKLNQKKYTDPKLKKYTLKYTQDLAKLMRENSALKNGSYSNLKTRVYTDKVMHVHRWTKDENNNEILAVMNFGDENYPEFILRDFPDGKWKEVLSSNDKNYGGNGEYLNNKVISREKSNISLPAQSIVFLKKIKD